MVKLKIKLCWFVILNFTLSILMASVYDVGDLVSETHQNITKSTCYAGNEYDVPDDWKLADWNGATNGGHYNVIFIEMEATWDPAGYNAQNGPPGVEYQEYEDNDHVKFLISLSDLNQPYSCTQWGNMPDGGGAQTVHDTGYDIWELFETASAFPSTVWIDHEMRVHDMMSNAGSWSIGSRIDDMLEACGNLCPSNNNIYVPEEYNNIQSAINNSYLGDTIWVAPGTYSGEGNIDLNFDGKAITVMSQAGAEQTIIDCGGTERGFTFASGEDSTSILDGFTIINGNRSQGGGIYCYYSSPTIKNCIITNCTAQEGGGIAVIGGAPVIKESIITDNTATIYSGGGIHIISNSNAILSDLVISGNHGYWHGGIFIWTGSYVLINNSIISGNTQVEHTGAIGIEGGAGANLVNLTITNNSIGGVSVWNGANVNILNSIITNHPYEEIMIGSLDNEENNVTIAYSNIDDGNEGIWQQGVNDNVYWVDGNIDDDPLFMDAENEDYNLQDSSPCIDSGTSHYEFVFGDVLIVDIPDSSYNDSAPDMGAIEYECGAELGDLNDDGQWNILDIVTLANCILGQNCVDLEYACAADLDGNGNYNVLDIVTLAQCVLAGNCDGSRVDDASEAALIKKDNLVSIEANGFIGGVQMTLSHGSDFTIKMTGRALFADYLTTGNETRLLVISPETEELFSYNGEFEITEIIVANSQYEVSVDMPIATGFTLSDAYPNPFNPVTTMTLTMPMAGEITVEVYNLLGQSVAILTSGYMEASTYTLTWDATDAASGMYFVQADAEGFTKTQKLMLVK